MSNNKKIAESVLEAVGGKDNVISVTHCMTRLRFDLKDHGIPSEEDLKKIQGVLGVAQAGDQYQIIIGQNVPKVYEEICRLGGFDVKKAIDENLDKANEKITLKTVCNSILNYLAGSMTPVIPVLMALGMFKTVNVIFCDLLHVLANTSDLYIFLDFMYNAGLYFMPLYVGYHAAKKIGLTPVLGLYLGAILIAPGFLSLVTEGTAFTVFGISVAMRNYSSTVLPILLSVAVAYFIEKGLKKIVPDALSTILIPTLTIFISAAIAFIIAAPAGYIIGNYLGVVLQFIADHFGFVGLAIIAALWEYLVMTGMHIVLLMPAFAIMMSGGSDPVMFVAGKCATFAAMGMALGTFLRMKEKNEKATAAGFFISGFVGGVTEPVLYGIGLKYKRPFIAMSIGAAIGAAYNGITGVTANVMSASSALGVLAFSGSTSANFINGTIGCFLALIISAVLTYLFAFNSEEIESGTPRQS